MASEIDPNFFVEIGKIYSKLFKLRKKEEDTVIKFAMYIDKELNKKGGKSGEGLVLE